MYDILRSMGVRDEILKSRARPTIYNADGTVASVGTDATNPDGTAPNTSQQHTFKEFAKQAEFANAVFSGKYKFLLYGGAIRGGKTYIMLAIVFVLCKVFPMSRWAIVRKSHSALRRNTIPTFNKLRPHGFVGNLNYSSWTSTCTNGSEIIFMAEAIKEDPELNRFRGLEVNGFFPEEMNELEEVTFNKMVERAGTWIIPSIRRIEDESTTLPDGRVIKTGRRVEVERKSPQPPTVIAGTCNPDFNWVKRKFYDPWLEGTLKAPWYYLPASPYDNPFLPEGYVKTLEEVLPENDQEKFLRGNWSVAAAPDQLIQMEWLIAAREIEHLPGQNILALDVGRFGDDPSVLALVNGNALIHFKEYVKQRTTRLAEILRHEMQTTPASASNTRVDATGLGAGVVDDCVKYGFNVVEVIWGGKPSVPHEESVRMRRMTRNRPHSGLKVPRPSAIQYDEDGNPIVETNAFPWRFFDLRSQMWWMFARRLEAGEFALPDALPARAIEDLITVRYEIRSDKTIKIESKEEIYKRIGRSTDYGDALVTAAFELEIPKVRVETEPSRSQRAFR